MLEEITLGQEGQGQLENEACRLQTPIITKQVTHCLFFSLPGNSEISMGREWGNKLFCLLLRIYTREKVKIKKTRIFL